MKDASDIFEVDLCHMRSVQGLFFKFQIQMSYNNDNRR